MNKYNTILEAPLGSRSGYGEWSDAIYECLLSYSKMDIKVNTTSWGACAKRNRNKLDDIIDNNRVVADSNGMVASPDVFISVTIPNLSPAARSKVGRYNINVSAGIEVTDIYDNVVEGLNNHDLNIVCSEFAKEIYAKRSNQPIEVIPWSVDTNIYKRIYNIKDNDIIDIAEKQAFLFVGQITHGNIFLDRKDVGNLIKTFCSTFSRKDDVALILKSSGISFSTLDRNHCMERIQAVKHMVAQAMKRNIADLPTVYLLHGELTPTEMNMLYNHPKVMAHISFSHGEGFGMPLLQASLSGKPVIAPNYSGHLDFLPKDRAILLEGTLDEIHPSMISEYFPKGSKWFNVDYAKASIVMKNFLYNDRTLHNSVAVLLAKDNAHKFNMDKMKYRWHKIMDKYIKI